MQDRGHIELRQVVLFVAVALVLNGQFTWWVARSLKEDREWLDLQRQVIVQQAEAAAADVELRLANAARRLLGLPSDALPRSLEPFYEIRVTDRAVGPASGWTVVDGAPAYRRLLPDGRVATALLDTHAPRRWLSVTDPQLRLAQLGTQAPDLPSVELGEPLSGQVVVASAERWSKVLTRYRRRVVLVVAQGALLVAAMAAAVALVWTALRREGRRERQHQNFVSAITHELKTPLAGIRLAIETVLSGRVDAEGQKKFLGNALADAERLSDLVQKVLEVTRYAGGAHRMNLEIGDFTELVESEMTAAGRRAAARGVVLEEELEQGVQAPFDPEAMAIVCSNLLENALKYAKGGDQPRVRVTLRLDGGVAVLEVRDNGIGIAARDLASIFQPFFRAADEVTRRTPGTGIGLYVASEIVAAHGGRLTAASDGPGKGATFQLTIPGASLFSVDDN